MLILISWFKYIFFSISTCCN